MFHSIVTRPLRSIETIYATGTDNLLLNISCCVGVYDSLLLYDLIVLLMLSDLLTLVSFSNSGLIYTKIYLDDHGICG